MFRFRWNRYGTYSYLPTNFLKYLMLTPNSDECTDPSWCQWLLGRGSARERIGAMSKHHFRLYQHSFYRPS
jgi:hypothetical protein